MKETLFQTAMRLAETEDIRVRALGWGSERIIRGKRYLDKVEFSIHGNVIVTVHINGSIDLTDCGYATVTTGEAMTEVLRALKINGWVNREKWVMRYNGRPFEVEEGRPSVTVMRGKMDKRTAVEVKPTKLTIKPEEVKFYV